MKAPSRLKLKAAERQQQRPGPERAALFRDRQGVNEGGGGQPRHEGGVFHRIPEPPAAPAQFVVGPPASQGNAQGEERPSDVGPRPRPTRPSAVQPAGQQPRHGEGERHREADVAGVEHRWMHDQPEVLQQGDSSRHRRRAPRAAGAQRDCWSGAGSSGSQPFSSPITPNTRARMPGGNAAPRRATALIHSVMMRVHSSSEPSWAPQRALTLYCQGSRLLELCAT